MLGLEVLSPADGVRFKSGLLIWNCSLLVAYCMALTRTVPGAIGGVEKGESITGFHLLQFGRLL
jgi:hypothetical protein